MQWEIWSVNEMSIRDIYGKASERAKRQNADPPMNVNNMIQLSRRAQPRHRGRHQEEDAPGRDVVHMRCHPTKK